jgi:hypothetical protein
MLQDDPPLTRCIRCGYDLRTADRTGRCSECGLAVEDSIKMPRGHSPVAKACGVVGIGFVLAVPPLGPFVAVFAGIMLFWMRGREVEPFQHGIVCAALIAGLVGTMVMTAGLLAAIADSA